MPLSSWTHYSKWINPDNVWGGYSITFIYDGNMYYGADYGVSHSQIISDNALDYDSLDNKGLFGRTGLTKDNEKVVSFWETDSDLYQKLLSECLERLLKDMVINRTYLVSTPLIGLVPLSEVHKTQPQVLTHAQRMKATADNIEHTQSGTAKADQLKREKYGYTTKDNDYITRWRNTQSESFDKKLMIILESL